MSVFLALVEHEINLLAVYLHYKKETTKMLRSRENEEN